MEASSLSQRLEFRPTAWQLPWPRCVRGSFGFRHGNMGLFKIRGTGGVVFLFFCFLLLIVTVVVIN